MASDLTAVIIGRNQTTLLERFIEPEDPANLTVPLTVHGDVHPDPDRGRPRAPAAYFDDERPAYEYFRSSSQQQIDISLVSIDS
jgi:hypothetical protein